MRENIGIYQFVVEAYKAEECSQSELINLGVDSFKKIDNEECWIFNTQYLLRLISDGVLTFKELVQSIKNTKNLLNYFENSKFFESLFNAQLIDNSSIEFFCRTIVEQYEINSLLKNKWMTSHIQLHNLLKKSLLLEYLK